MVHSLGLQRKFNLKAVKEQSLRHNKGKLSLIGVRVCDESVTEVDFLGFVLKLDDFIILLLGDDTLIEHLLNLRLGVIDRVIEFGITSSIDLLVKQFFIYGMLIPLKNLTFLPLISKELVLTLIFGPVVIFLELTQTVGTVCANRVRKRGLLFSEGLGSLDHGINQFLFLVIELIERHIEFISQVAYLLLDPLKVVFGVHVTLEEHPVDGGSLVGIQGLDWNAHIAAEDFAV